MFAITSVPDSTARTAQQPAGDADLPDMTTLTETPQTADDVVVVPCAARPSTGFVHLDGPCRCFAGGPAPEFAPMVHLERRAG